MHGEYNFIIEFVKLLTKEICKININFKIMVLILTNIV